MLPSVNPELLDSRTVVSSSLPNPVMQSLTQSWQRKCFQAKENGHPRHSWLLLRESSGRCSSKPRRCTPALPCPLWVIVPSPWTSLTQPLFIRKLVIMDNTTQVPPAHLWIMQKTSAVGLLKDPIPNQWPTIVAALALPHQGRAGSV